MNKKKYIINYNNNILKNCNNRKLIPLCKLIYL